MKNILITGGAGFIGSHLAINIKRSFKNVQVIALDNLKRKGSELNVERLKKHQVKFLLGDVRNQKDLNFKKVSFSLIIECSAEPSVLAGYGESADYVINTNLLGAINCLELARKHCSDFIFLSTSRVYPIRSLSTLKYSEKETRFELSAKQTLTGVSKNGISELFPIEGWRSIYGCTKLSAELFIQEYSQMYGLRSIINRCSVITGPWQMGKIDQGVFVFWLLNHYFKKNLKYIGYKGEGKQVRDLLHVDDLCDLIITQIQNLKECNGQTFNVGGGLKNSLSLQETTQLCREITGHKIKIQKDLKGRVVDIPIYISDNSKVTNLTGWKPKINCKQTFEDIFDWINKEENALKKVLL